MNHASEVASNAAAACMNAKDLATLVVSIVAVLVAMFISIVHWRKKISFKNQRKQENAGIAIDKDIFEQIKLVNPKIEFEYAAIHARVGWFILLQGLLPSAFVQLFTKQGTSVSRPPDRLMIGVCFFAPSTCGVILIGIWAGHLEIVRMKGHRTQFQKPGEIHKVNQIGAPLGSLAHCLVGIVTAYALPFLAVVGWIVVLIFAF